MDDITFTGWRKSSFSFANGNCLEVAGFRKSSRSESGNCAEVGSCGHGVAVRDSKDREGPVLTFSGTTWGKFLAAIRQGQGRASLR